ncbi:alpha/beta hydrolase [Azorhizobium oxalatiphilum]|uniref:Alpha/beta hydrolase n=1 Tax=Azorhizobium oxalatiphilum TaxID=980631 RepID=A0A917BP08_9HYPH|nr:alpha/beta hydrolase [Azorhizobium oxalatiphilum]GGF48545.1 alpha/beta hydrolase [Azorhizobium oxalatiphilum]
MDYEAEYDNRARVPNHSEIIADWIAQSARLRGDVPAADIGVPYGPSSRQSLDILWPDATRQAPIVLFFHGGYWQRQHPREVSFVAQGCLAHGVAMALAGYDLAPHVPVGNIVAQARGAAVCLHHRVKRRIVVSGHSAGGHLAAALTATRWHEIDPRSPDDMVTAGLGLAGVYELAPLLSTRHNEALRLSESEADRLSPIHWSVPAGRRFSAYVGAEESGEFRRQSHDLASAWRAQGIEADSVEVKGANHFTVVNELADPTSAMVARLVELANASEERAELAA